MLINTAFGTGFCTFVLSNDLKTLPPELYVSARVHGASVFRRSGQLTLPLYRPALAALATLQVTWIDNEFCWATMLLQSGERFSVSSAMDNLEGRDVGAPGCRHSNPGPSGPRNAASRWRPCRAAGRGRREHVVHAAGRPEGRSRR